MIKKNYSKRKTVIEYGDKVYSDYWSMFQDLIDNGQAPEGYDKEAMWPLEEWFIKNYLKLDTVEKEVIGMYENSI